MNSKSRVMIQNWFLIAVKGMKLCLKFISVAENFRGFFKVKGSAKKRCREMHLVDFKADCYFILLVKGLIKGFLRCRVVSMSISVFRTRTMTATFRVFVCSWTVAIYRAITYPNVFTSKTQRKDHLHWTPRCQSIIAQENHWELRLFW